MASSVIERPAIVEDAHLEFLDDLRESCAVNMFGARPYLIEEFDMLKEEEAGQILSYWMKTFSARHPK